MSLPTDQDTLPDAAWLHALSHIPKIGTRTLITLLRRFESGKNIWQTFSDHSTTPTDIRPEAFHALRHFVHTLDPVRLWEAFQTTGIEAISYADPRYPVLLREIPDAPPLLYSRGTYDWNQERPLITIVGTRKPSPYGRQVVQDFSRRLSQAGFTIISGLAFGIDSLAHESTLESHGITLAVIGSGVDDRSITPQSHLTLAHRIIENQGVILSEYMPGTQASTGTFPARNRIMTGMSPFTLVIEAGENSGTLITARLALDYHRDVGAIPGSLFAPGTLGCHRLIQGGAKLVTSLEDILEEFSSLPMSAPSNTTPHIPLTEDETLLVQLLSQEALHIDRIISQTGKKASEITMLLTLLEMKGLAKNIGGMHYIRTA